MCNKFLLIVCNELLVHTVRSQRPLVVTNQLEPAPCHTFPCELYLGSKEYLPQTCLESMRVLRGVNGRE